MTQDKKDLLEKLRDYVESPQGARISKFQQYQLIRAKFGSINNALIQAGVLEIYKKKKKKQRINTRQTDEDLLEELKQFIMSNDHVIISEFPKYQRVYYRFGSMETAMEMLEIDSETKNLLARKRIHIANKKYSDDELIVAVRDYYMKKIKEPENVSKKRTLWLHRFETQKNAIIASNANAIYLIAKIARILELDYKDHEEYLTENEKILFKTISNNINEFVEKNIKR